MALFYRYDYSWGEHEVPFTIYAESQHKADDTFKENFPKVPLNVTTTTRHPW